jgi:hypothetical protein
MMGFVESILFNVLELVSYCAYYLFPTTIDQIYLYIIAYLVMCILVSIFAYIITKEKKLLLYITIQEEDKRKWYQQLFESMFTGLLLMKNGKFVYANKTLRNFSHYLDSTSVEDPNLADVTLDDYAIHKLLSDCEDSVINLKELLQRLKYDNENNKISNNNFIFLSNKTFKINDCSNIKIEIYYRFYIDDGDLSDNFEFIFNDVTRIQEIEEKKA